MENSNLVLTFSSRFKEILNKISDDIVTQFILNLEGNQDYVYSFSFIDITDYEDQISFLQSNKYSQIIKDKDYRDVDGSLWSSTSRNEMKIGRFIMKIAPNFKQQEIENFVNLYKSEYKNSLKNTSFKIVDGEDIIKYYHGRRYYQGNGPLNKSCMRHDNCLKFLELYKMNPDKIKMVVLLDNERDLLKGRALLWKLDVPKDMWLLDRIYTTTDSDVFLFKKYAEKNGWLYKENQTFDCVNVIENKEKKFIEMRIWINDDNFLFFPYIDTLLYYNKREKYLTNSEKDYDELSDVIKLREINGNDSGNENFVFDVINNEIISISDSTYCYFGEGYTHRNNAFFIKHLDEYCFSNNLRYSILSKNFLPVNVTVYSYNLKSFIDRRESVKVFFSKDKNKFDYFLKKDLNNRIIKYYDDNYYLIDLMIKGIDGYYYFKDEYDEEKLKNIKKLENDELKKAISNSKFLNDLFSKKKKKKTSNTNANPFNPLENKSTSIDIEDHWWNSNPTFRYRYSQDRDNSSRTDEISDLQNVTCGGMVETSNL